MDGFPYQPPLLSLQDMLNLSDSDEEGWQQRNPFSISNFFEPIISPTKGGAPVPTISRSPLLASNTSQQSSSTSHAFDGSQDPQEGFEEWLTPSQEEEEFPQLSCVKEEPRSDLTHHQHTPEAGAKVDPDDEAAHSDFDFDIFDEDVVKLELQQADSVHSEETQSTPVQIVVLDETSTFKVPPTVSPKRSILCRPPTRKIEPPEKKRVCEERVPIPSLREVHIDDVENEKKPHLKQKILREKFQKSTIQQIEELIGTLKRYSNALDDFLEHEGHMILEQHSAQHTLQGLFPAMSEMNPSKDHPLYLAHSVRQALVDRVKGRTTLSKLPKRRSVIWRSSDLLSFQKAILESAIHRREFFLQCRFSELLLEMGFDHEDLERLRACTTRESELGLIRALVEEHNFQSKLKDSVKTPIVKIRLRKDLSNAVPRVLSLPTPESLVIEKWKLIHDIQNKTLLSNIGEKDIDWLFVIKKLGVINPKLRVNDDDCRRTYEEYINPSVNAATWSQPELVKLRIIRNKYPSASWTEIADNLKTNRTPFACFVKYKLYCFRRMGQPLLPRRFLRDIEEYLNFYKGNLGTVDYALSKFTLSAALRYALRPGALVKFCTSSLNPRVKKGVFTVIEDALLLVAMENCRPNLLDPTACFDPIGYYLPWRYSTTWRNRIGRLLTSFYFKIWTIEDDKNLIELVNKHGAKFKVIQRSFPNKDRQQCRSRYIHLTKVLSNATLEQYHKVYENQRKNLRLRRLNEVAAYLEMTIRSKLTGGSRSKYVRQADIEFLKLRRVPTNNNLECYLLAFPVKLLSAALERLSITLITILEKFQEGQHEQIVSRIQGFNRRRSFDPKSAASIASALAYSRANLTPKDKLGTLTEFESQVYSYHEYFSLKARFKITTRRKHVPSMTLLQKIPSIKRLIDLPAPDPSRPVIIVGQKVQTEADIQEAELFEALDKRKRGGALKGCKRKRTQIRENRARAAKLRWERKAALEDNLQNTILSEVPTTPSTLTDWIDFDQPLTPATPSSVISTCASDTTGSADIDSAACKVGGMFRTVISDHSYILPNKSSSDHSYFTLAQAEAEPELEEEIIEDLDIM